MKTFLAAEKIVLEQSRQRIVTQRLGAIKRRNAYQIDLLGDLIHSLDDAIWNIDFENRTPKQFRRRFRKH